MTHKELADILKEHYCNKDSDKVSEHAEIIEETMAQTILLSVPEFVDFQVRGKLYRDILKSLK